jgi:hypothetical protein
MPRAASERPQTAPRAMAIPKKDFEADLSMLFSWRGEDPCIFVCWHYNKFRYDFQNELSVHLSIQRGRPKRNYETLCEEIVDIIRETREKELDNEAE